MTEHGVKHVPVLISQLLINNEYIKKNTYSGSVKILFQYIFMLLAMSQ